jgi:hypothetical protein
MIMASPGLREELLVDLRATEDGAARKYPARPGEYQQDSSDDAEKKLMSF